MWPTLGDGKAGAIQSESIRTPTIRTRSFRVARLFNVTGWCSAFPPYPCRPHWRPALKSVLNNSLVYVSLIYLVCRLIELPDLDLLPFLRPLSGSGIDPTIDFWGRARAAAPLDSSMFVVVNFCHKPRAPVIATQNWKSINLIVKLSLYQVDSGRERLFLGRGLQSRSISIDKSIFSLSKTSASFSGHRSYLGTYARNSLAGCISM